MSRLKRLIVEIHHRSLWQVLVIYCGGAWVAYQVVWTFTESLGLPTWFPRVGLVLVIVLLPVILATAYVQEGVGERAPGRTIFVVAVLYAGSALVGFYLVMGLTRQFELPGWLPGLVGVLLIVLLPFVLWTALVKEKAPGEVAEIEAPVRLKREGIRGALTWRNALVGAIALFALLGVGVTGYMGMRLLGIGPVGSLVAKGVIEPGERIVLADFENLTTDSLLGVVVTEALRTDMSQSRQLRLAEPDHLRRVLARMEKDPGVTLDETLAREVAVREGLRAVIAGQVSSAGTSYVLSARLVAPEMGEALAGWREAARDSTELISAIDRLSKDIRQRAGESLTSIRHSAPLAQVTTGSLKALKKYTEGVQQESTGKRDRAIALLQEAIALDSSFASAYRVLGAIYSNEGARVRSVEATSKAYELRNRLTETERYMVTASYHSSVTGDVELAIDAYRALVEISVSAAGLNNLGVLYQHLHDFERAETLYQRALVAEDSLDINHYYNIFEVQVTLGKFDEARLTVERMTEKLPHFYYCYAWLADLAAYRGDYATAEAHIQALQAGAEEDDTPNRRLRYQTAASYMRANLALLHGKLADARRHYADMLSIYERLGTRYWILEGFAVAALLDVWFGGDPARTTQMMEAWLGRYPISDMAPLDRPYLVLARFYALAGQPERARAVLEEYETTVDPALRGYRERPAYHRAAGAVALAEGRHRESIPLLRLGTEVGEYPVAGLALLGRAYDLDGQADSAVAVYERYLTQPQAWRTLLPGFDRGNDPFWLPLIYERLGDLYEQQGDTAKAIYYYSKLVDLWKDADPELQPRVEAAGRAIEVLSPDA